MFVPPFSLFFNLGQLALESNMVIGLRMMRLAAGGPQAATETELMITEKMRTAASLMVENTMALASGKSLEAVSASSVARYRREVRANHKRLTR